MNSANLTLSPIVEPVGAAGAGGAGGAGRMVDRRLVEEDTVAVGGDERAAVPEPRGLPAEVVVAVGEPVEVGEGKHPVFAYRGFAVRVCLAPAQGGDADRVHGEAAVGGDLCRGVCRRDLRQEGYHKHPWGFSIEGELVAYVRLGLGVAGREHKGELGDGDAPGAAFGEVGIVAVGEV